MAPEIKSPKGFHVVPSNFNNCICLMGPKSVALVDTMMPGNSIGSSRLWMLAASFMMFSRVRLSPHALSTATKGAVQALTRSAGAELGEQGVRVNCISPGAIVTGIFAKNAGVEASKADRLTDLIKGAFASLQPIPRAGLPDDIAQAAAYLAGDGSSFINGQDIVIDGGMTSVTRGWTTAATGRAEMSKRLKQAAAAL